MALGEDLPAALGQRLLNSDALRPRLSALLGHRLGTPVHDVLLERLLAMDAPAIRRLCLQIGAAWHGRALIRLLDGEVIRTLTARLGFDPRPAAIRFAASAPATNPVPSDALAERIEGDGAACLAAWCASLPSPARAYAQLVLSPHANSRTDHAAYGPALVRAVLGGAAS